MSYTKTGQSITLNPVAFKKISYHSIRFLTDDVNGVLTGTITKDQITITNAYPLFHTRIMAPTLEIAFQLIEAQLKDDEKIIGFYESLIKYKKDFVSEIGTKILDTITEKQQITPIFISVVSLYNEEFEDEEVKNEDELENENEQIEEQNQRLDLQIYQYQKKINDFLLKKVNDQLTDALDYEKLFSDFEKGLHRKIIDFDHHLEDCSLDFRNTYVVQ